MKFRKLKFALKLHFSWNVFIYMAMLLMASLFTWTGYYLYQSVYQSLLYTETTTQLKALVAPETFNLSDVQKLLESIGKRENQPKNKWLNAPNIFLKTRATKTTPAASPAGSAAPAETVPDAAILP